MSITGRLGVAAAAAVGLATVAAVPAQASVSWAPTATRAMGIAGLRALGAAPAGQSLHVVVALQLRHATTATPAAVEPTASQASAVVSYLKANGFSATATPDHVLVDARGTVGAAERAFHTRIGLFRTAHGTAFANTTAASVPTALRTTVASVLGLQNVTAMSTAPAMKGATVSCLTGNNGSYPCTYDPQDFWKAYDAQKAPTGSASTIAVFAEGDLTGVLKDLRKEEAANKLPQVPVTVVRTGVASPDTSGADEWDLDTQYSTGMAGTVNDLVVYDSTTLNDPDITLSFDRFVTDHRAQAGSASFGECEAAAYLDGALQADDEIFQLAADQGQTVFASSGDTGGFCPVAPNNGAPVGVPDVNYPAASPYVVAVGGTTLITDSSGAYAEEIAWLAGGGGPAEFEPTPYWQDGVVPGATTPVGFEPVGDVACSATVGIPCKGLPDIAMDADPNSGADVYINGQPTGVGGTSLASPLALGVWARLLSAHPKLGFGAPVLYKAAGSTAFHDITLGDTGPYPATPGWDYATGLGTFDVAQAVAKLH